jgi:hypothetical protein
MSKKFAMNTTAFLILWKSMLGKKNQWENFVVSCFDTFAKDNNDYTGTYTGYKSFNPEQTEHLMYFGSLSGHDEPVEHTDEHKYQFLSEKVYAKCANLKSKMVDSKHPKDDTDETKALRTALRKKIALPDGYLRRMGSASSSTTRVSAADMLDLFLKVDDH